MVWQLREQCEFPQVRGSGARGHALPNPMTSRGAARHPSSCCATLRLAELCLAHSTSVPRVPRAAGALENTLLLLLLYLWDEMHFNIESLSSVSKRYSIYNIKRPTANSRCPRGLMRGESVDRFLPSGERVPFGRRHAHASTCQQCQQQYPYEVFLFNKTGPKAEPPFLCCCCCCCCCCG